jgi:hypothetical protein
VKKLMRNVIGSQLPFLRKIAAVVMLCFISAQSDAQKTVGKIARPIQAKSRELSGAPILINDTARIRPVIKEATKPEPEIMGIIRTAPQPDKERNQTKKKGK